MLLLLDYKLSSANPSWGEAVTFVNEEGFASLEDECQRIMRQPMADYAEVHPRAFFMTFFGVPYRMQSNIGQVDYAPDESEKGFAADSRELGSDLAAALSNAPVLDLDTTTVSYSMRVLPNDFEPSAVQGNGEELARRMQEVSRRVVAFTLEPPSLA